MSNWFKKQQEKQRPGDGKIPPKAQRKGPPPPPPDVVDDYQGPPEVVEGEIVAHRFWGLDWSNPDDPALRSVAWNVRWDGPTLTAHMVPQRKTKQREADNWFGGYMIPIWTASGADAKPPSNASEAGIYALRCPDEARAIYGGYASSAVRGTVALSGQVVVGTKGYRAERATVRSLCLTSHARDEMPEGWNPLRLATHLAEKYGVDEPGYEMAKPKEANEVSLSFGGMVYGRPYTIAWDKCAEPDRPVVEEFNEMRGERILTLE
jgi:hypothetical protein